MEKIDLLIAGLAVLAVVGSAVGWVTYSPSFQQFTVTFTEEAHDGVSDASDSLDGGGSTTLPLGLSRHNVTEVEIEVTVETQDNIVEQRTVDVSVEGPMGRWTDSDSDTLDPPGPDQVSFTFTFDISELPADFETQARSVQAALNTANATFGHMNGTGTWNVTVDVTGGTPPLTASYDVSAVMNVVDFHAQATQETAQPQPI